MAAHTAPTETLSGSVEATNPKGIKLAGEWLNFSSYHAVPHPVRGQLVTVTVDRTAHGAYIRSLVLDGEAPAESSTPARSWSHRGSDPARDRTITRLAVLKAAAGFAASRPDATSTDVLQVAAVWEAWITREAEQS